jgi:hypothetical protein
MEKCINQVKLVLRSIIKDGSVFCLLLILPQSWFPLAINMYFIYFMIHSLSANWVAHINGFVTLTACGRKGAASQNRGVTPHAHTTSSQT